MAYGFEIAGEGDNKLWVSTPKPVTNFLWAALVYRFFPSLTLRDPEGPEKQSWQIYKTVKRDDSEARSIMADGQYGLWMSHAFLPDDNRANGISDRTGVIYLPDWAHGYLPQLEEAIPTERSAEIFETVFGYYADYVKQMLESAEGHLKRQDTDDKLLASFARDFHARLIYSEPTLELKPCLWEHWTRTGNHEATSRYNIEHFACYRFIQDLREALQAIPEGQERAKAILGRLREIDAPYLHAA